MDALVVIVLILLGIGVVLLGAACLFVGALCGVPKTPEAESVKIDVFIH